MSYVKVYTQQELDAVLARGIDTPDLCGNAEFVVRGSATVRAWDSATVRAWDSATVHAGDSATVHAWDSATVRAWDSATVHAGGSATVHAGGSATVRAWGSATVHAGKLVAVQRHGSNASVTGGQVIEITDAESPADWGEIQLAEPHEDGVLLLYKAVGDDYVSSRDFHYKPGSVPVATDWDGGGAECGGGLHFCASPSQALEFNSYATRFMACPVALKDMAVVPSPSFPSKIKARGCCAPIWEVDLNGKRVDVEGDS